MSTTKREVRMDMDLAFRDGAIGTDTAGGAQNLPLSSRAVKRMSGPASRGGSTQRLDCPSRTPDT